MRPYDTLHVGDRTEQVKLWGKALSWFHLGDQVAPPRGGLAPDGDSTVDRGSHDAPARGGKQIGRAVAASPGAAQGPVGE